MKRTLQILLALSLISMFIISPVAAATSQGLEWGIESGDQWNFDMKSVTEGTQDFAEVVYFEVTGGVSAIPNILTDWLAIPDVTFDVTWENGTSLGLSAFMFIFWYLTVSNKFVVPIGNYTLLGELYADSAYNGTAYNKASYWGMEVTDLDIFGTLFDIHIDYLKDDGMLAHWNVKSGNYTLTMVRQGLPSFDIVGLIQDNLLLVGAGVVILILLVVICARRR